MRTYKWYFTFYFGIGLGFRSRYDTITTDYFIILPFVVIDIINTGNHS